MNQLLPDVIAGTLLLTITAYSTAGGADFGAGIWDLLAGKGPQAQRARELIDHAMAPVWEANNVWLVLGIVVCWTGFPTLFEVTFLNLYPLYALALLGLILRGAFFAFRHISDEPQDRRIANAIFGVASVLTPFFFAATLGAIASGQVHVHNSPDAVLRVSFGPMPIAFGLVSLTATALTGASFLVGDARREGSPEMIGYFRRRAALAAVALIVVGTAALAVVAWQSPGLLRAMFGWPAVVFAAATMLLTPVVAVLHWRGVLRWYRVLTVGAVASLVLAWGVAQSPYLLPGELTISDAIAPVGTQVLLLISAGVVLLVIGPSLGLLYYLDQRSALIKPES